MRIEHEKVAQIIRLLCEGMGIRATARLTDCHRDTVLSVLETMGRKCVALLDYKVRYIRAEQVQTDEIHTFVGRKQRRTVEYDPERGDFFTFLSVDRDSKLIINWTTGKRDYETTETFLHDLKARMLGRFQLTTDAYNGYCRSRTGGVRWVFGSSIDYARETKIYGHEKIAPFRYIPIVQGIKRKPVIGNPDMTLATTCHCERMNLSVASVHPPVHQSHAWLFKNTAKPAICCCLVHRAFQLLPGSFGAQTDTGTSLDADKRRLDG